MVVHAKLRKAPNRVKNATIHDYELEVYEVHKVTSLTENVPFTVYDAENINRDKEDVEDEEDIEDASLLSDETPKSPESGTPRASQDVSRISTDKLTSRIKPLLDDTPKSPDSGTPRASQEVSRISTDKLTSRSKQSPSS